MNKTTGGKICTAASGEVCGTGLKEVQETPGVFGGWEFNSNQEFSDTNNLGNAITVGPEGDLYVGTDKDPNPPDPGSPFTRVQKFAPDGTFLGQALVPTLTNGRPDPISVAVNSAGRVYTAVNGEQSQVDIFEQSEFTETGEGTDPLSFIYPHFEPRQVAIDPRNDNVVIGDQNASEVTCGKEACTPEQQGDRRVRARRAPDRLHHSVRKWQPFTHLGARGLARRQGVRLRLEQQQSQDLQASARNTTPVGETFVGSITQNTARVHTEVAAGFQPRASESKSGRNMSRSVHGIPRRGTGVRTRPPDAHGSDGRAQSRNAKYHYRVVAENSLGEAEFADGTFTTYPFVDLLHDSCPNALARKQTRTVALLDCRAYELASAASTGGYDVTSDLVPGRTPFEGRPDASGKLLYSVVDGGIPGTGNPTNRGPDPYVATRINEGEDEGKWTTEVPRHSGR